MDLETANLLLKIDAEVMALRGSSDVTNAVVERIHQLLLEMINQQGNKYPSLSNEGWQQQDEISAKFLLPGFNVQISKRVWDQIQPKLLMTLFAVGSGFVGWVLKTIHASVTGK